MIKQRGALLAKGWLLGIQFDTLFAENRYVDICRQAVAQAAALREAFRRAGIPLFGQSPTNQVFPIAGPLGKVCLFDLGRGRGWADDCTLLYELGDPAGGHRSALPGYCRALNGAGKNAAGERGLGARFPAKTAKNGMPGKAVRPHTQFSRTKGDKKAPEKSPVLSFWIISCMRGSA